MFYMNYESAEQMQESQKMIVNFFKEVYNKLVQRF